LIPTPLLDEYRRRYYLEARRDLISKRHCAKKTPNNWYRTIDRIVPKLATTPKLLIPDIKGEAHIVFEGGKLNPHHNLYYIISNSWNLRCLQAVLLSAVTQLFVATYPTKMHGGYLRFQAKSLRRLRLPQWIDVPPWLRQELAKSAMKRDIKACNRAAFTLYGLTREDQFVLEGVGK
jgi:hypothetical protein